MNAAMWTAKTGVQAQDAKLQAIANNLANVNTTGFKRDRVVFEDLFYAIEEIAAGKEFISSSMASKVIREMRIAEQRKAERASVALNSREDQVVRELLNGASNKEIANKLNLSDKTVKHYMTQIMQKFNARKRLEVVIEVQRMNGANDTQPRYYA